MSVEVLVRVRRLISESGGGGRESGVDYLVLLAVGRPSRFDCATSIFGFGLHKSFTEVWWTNLLAGVRASTSLIFDRSGSGGVCYYSSF